MVNLECTKLIRVVEFAVVTNDTAKERIGEQQGKATKAKIDPTTRIANNIEKKPCKLRKEKQFTNKTYFELYPSDPIPQRSLWHIQSA